MPALKTIFTPAGGESVTFSAGPTPSIVALPAVDGSNTAAIITNNGQGPVTIAWGLTSTAQPSLFNMPGTIRIDPGETELLVGSLAATVTSAAVQMLPPSNGTVTFTRGSVSSLWVFDAQNVEVL